MGVDIHFGGRRRPKLTWKKLTVNNCCQWKLKTVDVQERCTWTPGVHLS